MKNVNNKNEATKLLQQCKDAVATIVELIVPIFDIVEDQFFQKEDFEMIEGFIPRWLSDSGRCAESPMSKTDFEKVINYCNDELTNKLVYWFDLQSPIYALQDRIESVNILLSELYTHIPNYAIYEDNDYTSASRSMSVYSSIIHTCINSVFVHLASSFDLFTKIVYELENIPNLVFSKRQKLKSVRDGILYSPNKIKNVNLKQDGMIFSNPPILRKVCSFRDYYIHNGSWDYRCAVYESFVDDTPADVFVLLPDTDENGNLETSGSRNMFYSKGEKINITLPQIVIEVMSLYENTIKELIAQYPFVERERHIPDNFDVLCKNWNECYLKIKCIPDQDKSSSK